MPSHENEKSENKEDTNYLETQLLDMEMFQRGGILKKEKGKKKEKKKDKNY